LGATQAGTATATRAAVEIAPYTLIRTNPLLVPPMWTGHHEALDEIAALRERRVELTQPLLDRLYALAAAVPDDIRKRVVLPLSRAVFNDRDPKATTELAALGIDGLAEWLDLRTAERSRRAELESLVAAALTEDRERLRMSLGDRDFLSAAALVSPDLVHGAHRYATTPTSAHNKRMRKSEPKLSRYAERAAYRTSPFSHFTVVCLATWAATGSGPLRLDSRTARVQPNLLLLLRLADAATSHPDFASCLTYRLVRGLRRTETGYRFEVMNDDPEHSRIYRTRRSVVSVKANPVLDVLTEALRANPNGLSMADLHALLAQRSAAPMSTEVTHAFLTKLRTMGLLTSTLQLSQQDPAPALDFAERCADVNGEQPRRLAAQFRDLHERTERIGELDSVSRARAVEDLRSTWMAAFAQWGAPPPPTDSPLYEDVAVREPAEVSSARWEAVRADLARLLPALEPLNMSHPGHALLTQTMVDVLGPGGRCSYAEFVAMLPQVFTSERVTLASILAEINGRDSELEKLLELRERYLDAVSGTDDVELGDDLIDHLTEHTPARFRRSSASTCVFVQPLDVSGDQVDTAVVNAVLDGNGQFLSRFLPLYDNEWTELVRTHLRVTQPVGTTELRAVQGFNANVHPALLDRGFEMPTEDVDSASPVDLDGLSVVHDQTTGRLRLLDRSGEEVFPRYLGFLVPYLLPWELTALYLLSEPGQMRVDSANEWERRVPPEGQLTIRRYPRVRYRSLLLARRRWYVPMTLVPVADPAETPAEFLVRLDGWRVSQGIPQHVFLARVGETETESLGRPKPMFADLRSPLHVRCLPSWLAGARTVRIEEALPNPARPGVPDPHVGRNTVEYMIECWQTGGTA
jgi:hypothetical protein